MGGRPVQQKDPAGFRSLRKGMPYRHLRQFGRTVGLIFIRLFFRLHYEGLAHLPTCGPLILAANHTSMLDMFAIHTRIDPWIHWVAKKELFATRTGAILFTRLGCIPVDRQKADLSAARGIVSALRQKQIVGMFPQGTRVRDDQISQILPRGGAIHFAARSNVPILPVAIDGPFRLFGKVRIIFGEPFRLPVQVVRDWTQPDYDRASLQLMQHIYRLMHKNYPPADHLPPLEIGLTGFIPCLDDDGAANDGRSVS
jgi:1-acyl-sn-glycerol-3-phosphate acyltransferase